MKHFQNKICAKVLKTLILSCFIMQKQFFRAVAVVYLILGVLFLTISETNITGAVLGSFNSSSNLDFFGILFIIISAVLFASGKEYSLEDIINEKTSKTFRKTAIFLGRKHFEKGQGDLPASCTELSHQKETYKELFDVLELEKHYHKNPSMPQLADMQKRYHRHEVDHILGLDKAITYDARALSTGHRGAYRYIFDEKGKYVGLAVHIAGQKGYRYRWV